jgi:hypothetical protein
MKPVYFPFTYINNTVARDLCNCFGQITVYRPCADKIPESMQRLADEGILDLKAPVSGDEERLKSLIKEYEEWGELHQKNDMAFLKAIGERVPFFDDTFTTQLASQIKKIRDEDYSGGKPDILFNARLFLSLAQDYDIMQEGINRDLASVHEMEKKLLEGLTQEDEPFFSKNSGIYLKPNDSGRYKIKERIEAWTYIMSNDQEEPRFLITDNRDAFDFIVEKTADIKDVVVIDPVQICGFHSAKGAGDQISLKLSGIINKSRRDFIDRILGQEMENEIEKDKIEINKNIFICLSEMPCLTY